MSHYDSCPECKQIGGVHSDGCPNDTNRKLNLHECNCDMPSCVWIGPPKDCPLNRRESMGTTKPNNEGCILADLFRRQAELNKRVGFDPPGGLLYAGKWLNNYIDAMIGELCELRDCTYWKHWYKEARDGRRFELHDPEHAKVEVIDILHFWISLAQCVGLTAKDVYDLYCRKMEKNHKRQDDDCTTQEAKGYEL